MSKTERLDEKGQRVYARLVAHVAREIVKALNQEKGRGMTRASLARTIGRDKAFISRKLSGTENMELRTVAAMLSALGYEMDVAAHRIDAPPSGTAKSNFPPSTIEREPIRTASSRASTVQTVKLSGVDA